MARDDLLGGRHQGVSGKSKNFIYTEHLGVWNKSGHPVKLKIVWTDPENKERSFETDSIPSSDEPRITLIHTPGFKDAPGVDDDSPAFMSVTINGKPAHIQGMTR